MFNQKIYYSIILIFLTISAAFADPVYTDEQADKFIQTYALKYKLPPDYIRQTLAQAVFQPASYETQQPHPGVTKGKSWATYRRQFINPRMISAGQRFMCQHRDALNRAQSTYGVPSAIILGIIGIETAYGGFTGNFRVLDALATIAFSTPRRVEFFQDELAQYIRMCYQYNLDPTELKGAIDGGFGLSQFMPSSYLKFAVSDNNTTPNLFLANDAIMSVANYINEHDWQVDQAVVSKNKKVQKHCEEPLCSFKPLDNFFVIYSYNHSYKYSMAVYQLGSAVVKQVKQNGCS